MFEKGYNDFLISEFMIEKMEEEKISVQELAKKLRSLQQRFKICAAAKPIP